MILCLVDQQLDGFFGKHRDGFFAGAIETDYENNAIKIIFVAR